MQTKLGRRHLAGVALAAAAALAGTAPATLAKDAGAESVKPSACGTPPVLDPAGDSGYGAAPPPYPGATVAGNEVAPPDPAGYQKTAPNMDLREVFFTYAPGADGTKTLRANFVVENLSKAEPEIEYDGTLTWSLDFTYGADETEYYVDVQLVDGEYKYTFGAYDYSLTAEAVAGSFVDGPVLEEVDGQAFEGPNGVLSVEVPTEKIDGFAADTPITALNADVHITNPTFTTDITSFYWYVDTGDEGSLEWTVSDCGPVDEPKTDDPKVDPPKTDDTVKADPKTDTVSDSGAAAPVAAVEAPPAAVPAPLAAPAKPAVTKKAASKKRKCATAKAKAKKGKKTRRAAKCKARKKAARKRSRR
jgi:hypothetical protein